jgi:hypothetical protein
LTKKVILINIVVHRQEGGDRAIPGAGASLSEETVLDTLLAGFSDAATHASGTEITVGLGSFFPFYCGCTRSIVDQGLKDELLNTRLEAMAESMDSRKGYFAKTA